MKHLALIVMAALLLGACQSEEAADPVANTAPEPVEPENTHAASAGPGSEAGTPPDLDMLIARAIDHPDRPQTDRDRDAQRHPAEVVAFSGIEPGMRVLDVFTGGGYYAEILSRLVGPEGEVWAQNPPQFYERYGSADLDFRLADRRLPNVERQDRPIDDLALPPERFHAVVAAMVFHDFFWLSDDVPGVLGQLYAAMKPGAVMLITDHAAPDGTGAGYALEVDGKHRVEDVYVTRIMAEAGFELVNTSDVLRVPEDDRTRAFFEPGMRGKYTDRFVHLYRKPGTPSG